MTGKDGAARVLEFLRRGSAGMSAAAAPGEMLLEGGAHGVIAVPAHVVRRLLDDGVVVETGGALHLVSLERADLRSAPGKPEIGVERIEDPGGVAAEVLVNHAESPLSALARRKAKDGSPFLSGVEFAAGERLRADFSRGALMPRLGMNWTSPVAPGRRGGTGGIGELTDAALGARMRVERALDAVGPELSGPLVDVCCFLKGLEQVEAERGWPVRSAKIMLKTALAALARHYDPRAGRVPKAGVVLQWGSDDYRPKGV